jgi:DNA-binding IclR family transcriptional regulator
MACARCVCIVALPRRWSSAVTFTMQTMSSESARSRPNGRAANAGVQSVDRALRLLKAVAAADQPSTAQELAQRCEVNRSTAWRLLSTLEAHGLVERDPVTGRYLVGYAAFQLATAEDHDALARRLRPLLQRTAQSTGEIVTLAIAKRFGLVYVDQADPPGPASPDWSGRQIPLHATSSGKVFLAWLPEEERAAVLPATLERFTPHTIVDRSALDRELERVRRDGYASCLGEFDYSNGVSAAVFDPNHRPVAVMNVWGPSVRVTRTRLPSLGRAALRAAHEMSLLLA